MKNVVYPSDAEVIISEFQQLKDNFLIEFNKLKEKYRVDAIIVAPAYNLAREKVDMGFVFDSTPFRLETHTQS